MKTVWIILITIIITGGLFGSGTYYFVNKQAKQKENTLQSQLAAKPDNGPSHFKNEALDYSIDYPASWTLYRYPDPNEGIDARVKLSDGNGTDVNYNEVLYVLPVKSDFCDLSVGGECAPGRFADSFELKVKENSGNLPLTELLKQENNPSLQGWRSEETTVGGQKAIKYWDDCKVDEGISCDSPKWLVSYKGHAYIIDYNLSDKTVDFDNIRDNIKFGSTK